MTTFEAVDPRTGVAIGEYRETDVGAVADAVAAAEQAFAATRHGPRRVRAGWLRAIADAFDAAPVDLLEVADRETALGSARLTGEWARTRAQVRLFAQLVDDGSYVEPVIDLPDPDSVPPRGDLRRMLVPIGPVANFAASNFPFAFSVPGGDTIAALAAGAPSW
ncbi:MAG TPA: aldehyde dehydrogenase family protein [Acidimicrobiia bacterium]